MTKPQMRPVLIHAAMMLGVLGIGTAIGASFLPGEWYAALNKPAFTPPGAAFGPIWTVLYLMIGWVGARKFLQGGARGLWVAQMALNFTWSPVFFGMQWPLGGMAIILGVLALVLAFIATEWRQDRVSALMFLPYAAWLTLASAVNAGVVLMN